MKYKYTRKEISEKVLHELNYGWVQVADDLLAKSPIKEKKVCEHKETFGWCKKCGKTNPQQTKTPVERESDKTRPTVPKQISMEMFFGDYTTPQQTYERCSLGGACVPRIGMQYVMVRDEMEYVDGVSINDLRRRIK